MKIHLVKCFDLACCSSCMNNSMFLRPTTLHYRKHCQILQSDMCKRAGFNFLSIIQLTESVVCNVISGCLQISNNSG